MSGVRISDGSPWVIICGRGGMADAPDLGSGAAGCMSSSLFARTTLRLILICGNSSFGRAPPCQGGGGGFEPRFPLHFFNGCVSSFYAAKRHHSQAVRQRSAKSPSPVRFRMVPPNQLHRIYDGAFSLQFDIHESCGFIANA